MTVYTVEKIVDNIDELQELAKLHYKEACPYADIPLNVDWERFVKLEQLSIAGLFTIRENEELVGYAIFFVAKSIEYSDSLQASLSNIFIRPDKRGRGSRFISWCDQMLKSMGVQVVYHHVKAKNDYGVLLKRLGYDIMNIEYAKRLD